MQQPIPIFCGFDPREAAGYATFCQSVLERSSHPVAFIPLHEPMLSGFKGQRDGSNAFIYSRFLIPHIQNYNGWAIFADACDMMCLDDIAKLWEMRSAFHFNKAVAVVKHDYKTRHKRKYVGTPMEADNANYPRKNWSSLMLWNCGHFANQRLTPEVVTESPGSFLHRFQWLADEQIGELPHEWNSLAGEQDLACASLIHYTLGMPGFWNYRNCDGAAHWHRAHRNATNVEGENETIMKRFG
jgi:hypothetical protein